MVDVSADVTQTAIFNDNTVIEEEEIKPE